MKGYNDLLTTQIPSTKENYDGYNECFKNVLTNEKGEKYFSFNGKNSETFESVDSLIGDFAIVKSKDDFFIVINKNMQNSRTFSDRPSIDAKSGTIFCEELTMMRINKILLDENFNLVKRFNDEKGTLDVELIEMKNGYAKIRKEYYNENNYIDKMVCVIDLCNNYNVVCKSDEEIFSILKERPEQYLNIPLHKFNDKNFIKQCQETVKKSCYLRAEMHDFSEDVKEEIFGLLNDCKKYTTDCNLKLENMKIREDNKIKFRNGINNFEF